MSSGDLMVAAGVCNEEHMSTRSITLAETCEILANTALTSAPKITHIGTILDRVGEQIDSPAVEVVGESLQWFARLVINAMQLAREAGIEIVDLNGKRGIADQVYAMKAFKEIQKKAANG